MGKNHASQYANFGSLRYFHLSCVFYSFRAKYSLSYEEGKHGKP